MSTDLDATILIVDDQDVNVELIEHVLRRAGYTAYTSTTDPCAVPGLHAANCYDLIILDLQMPVMDGFAVLKAIAPCDGGKRPVVLVMSADPSYREVALAAGASSFLSKPFVLKDVLRRVQNLLGARLTADIPVVA